MSDVTPLASTCQSLLLDKYRIPYEVEDSPAGSFESIRGEPDGPRLFWPRASRTGWPGRFEVEGLTAWGQTVPEALLRSAGPERSWTAAYPVVRDGTPVSPVLRSDRGDLALPFDPDDCIRNLLEERYLGPRGQSLGASRRLYYRIRPLLPREAQLRLRRRFARVQERVSFPDWPSDGALHELETFLLGILSDVVGWKPPRIAPWPDGFRWALLLTHDVERAPGYDFVSEVARREFELGFRSAFYFVPERDYRVDRGLLDQLRADGFEIGLHGLHHDGSDLEPGSLDKRLPAMRRYAEAWGATGFRSPATHRSTTMMPTLGFDYDTSYSDTARYEPQAGGTCSLHPYFIDGLVELPITLPMDHTLFEILLEEDARRWIEKAEWLRERGGMALMLTHPDYLLDPKVMRAYERFLDWASGDPTCWVALPSATSSWWRARAATMLVPEDGAWSAHGPASARVTVL